MVIKKIQMEMEIDEIRLNQLVDNSGLAATSLL